ncbi:MAG: ArnT family glycosyltransferase [Mastigocoleus sp.]
MSSVKFFRYGIWQYWRILWSFSYTPYIGLIIWTLPLLIFSSDTQSLMAHDEGLYAWRARKMIDSENWINPWSAPHHKTPGPYWLIAICYQLFGVSEVSTRLPSMVAGMGSILLLYAIANIILNKKVAVLAGAILSLEFLWLQYSRLGTPDVPTIFLFLLAILALLASELNHRRRDFWGFIFGFSLALGFLLRSFMIFLPIIAILPYLLVENRRHDHLSNPMIYIGFVVGLIPSVAWLWLNWQQYGKDSLLELVNFAVRLGSKERGNNGILFYLWNVPIKAFPWSLFSLLGLYISILRPISRYQLILVGVPLTLLLEISIFATRLPHYSLFLYPFIALLASVGLSFVVEIFIAHIAAESGQEKTKFMEKIVEKINKLPFSNFISNLPRNISYSFGILGIILFLASQVILIWGATSTHKYAVLTLILGICWCKIPLIWLNRLRLKNKQLAANYWLANFLITGWLTLAIAGSTGLLGDYNHDIKVFVQRSEIATVLQNHIVHQVDVGGKNSVLINFYTPLHGEELTDISQLLPNHYAWIPKKQVANLSSNYKTLGKVNKYALIQYQTENM